MPKHLPTAKASSFTVLLMNLAFSVFILFGMTSSMRTPMGWFTKFVSLGYYISVCCVHAWHLIFGFEHYILAITGFLVVTFIQLVLDILLLIVNREDEISKCYRWVGNNRQIAPPNPDCPSAVTVTIWVSLAVYFLAIALNFCNFREWTKHPVSKTQLKSSGVWFSRQIDSMDVDDTSTVGGNQKSSLPENNLYSDRFGNEQTRSPTRTFENQWLPSKEVAEPVEAIGRYTRRPSAPSVYARKASPVVKDFVQGHEIAYPEMNFANPRIKVDKQVKIVEEDVEHV